ncbi:MAG: IclR family transcriptional regulator [Pseudomonadota bacterium]
MSGERYGGLVKSAVRVIEILEFFEAERRPLKISEIVTALGMPQSSVSTLMKTMAAQGYVEFDAAERRYRPTARLAFLGHWTLGAPESVEQVQVLMRRLSDETDETVLLGAQRGLNMQYLSIIESSQGLRFSLRPGLMRPLHGSGLGIMLLTAKPDEEVGRIVRRFRAEHPEGEGGADEETTLARVREAREAGFFETFGIASPGAGTISTLLQMPSGLLLGVGVGGPVARLDHRREDFRKILIGGVRDFQESMTAQVP